MKKKVLVFVPLFLSAPFSVQADWCDGEGWFGTIKLSTRIEQADEAVKREIQHIQETSNALVFDVRNNVLDLSNELQTTNSNLLKQLVALCRSAKSHNYTNIEHEGIQLRDAQEVNAKIRLDLATIKVNSAIISYLSTKKNEYESLNTKILDKANELAVLRKSFERLRDPRSMNQGRNYDIVIKNACVSLGGSQKLRAQYSRRTSDELFREGSNQIKSESITSDVVEQFKKNCTL